MGDAELEAEDTNGAMMKCKCGKTATVCIETKTAGVLSHAYVCKKCKPATRNHTTSLCGNALHGQAIEEGWSKS